MLDTPKENKPIPYVNFAAQYVEERDQIIAIVDDVFTRGEFIGGAQLEFLESELAAYLGVKNIICLNSGTDALVLSMRALGIGPGDEVITPPNSFVASTAAIVQLGAVPVFADVRDDQNIDPEQIRRAITPRTKAIMPVHLTGRVAEMDAILSIAREFGLLVIEDSAQAIGSKYNGAQSGTMGDVGCFSTHPLKNLNAAGDGGFVAVKDDTVADKIRMYRNHGLRDRNTVELFGSVSRMDTLQAAILRMRLRGLSKVIDRRRENAAVYQQTLDPRHVFLPPCRAQEYNTFHVMVIQVDRRDELQRYLTERKVGTSVHYPIPIHLQPAAHAFGKGRGSFPQTEKQANRILSLPINQFTSTADVEHVARLVNAFYAAG